MNSPPSTPTEHPTNRALGGPGKCWIQPGRRAGGRGAPRSIIGCRTMEKKEKVLVFVMPIATHNWLSSLPHAIGTS